MTQVLRLSGFASNLIMSLSVGTNQVIASPGFSSAQDVRPVRSL